MGSPPPRIVPIPDSEAADRATTASPMPSVPKPPVVPTRMNVVTPSMSSSSMTIVVVGVPIIVVWTETGTPFTVPV